MVLNSFNWMDETTTGLLSQTTQLPLTKSYQNVEASQIISSQLSSIFKSLPIEPTSADLRSGLNCSGSSTPKKSIPSLNEFLKPHSILSQNNNSSESDDDDEQSKKDEINLYPLSNQVGGHTRLLLMNDKTVIKPLNIRELEFYQNIPGNDIQDFVPKYKGESK